MVGWFAYIFHDWVVQLQPPTQVMFIINQPLQPLLTTNKMADSSPFPPHPPRHAQQAGAFATVAAVVEDLGAQDIRGNGGEINDGDPWLGVEPWVFGGF